MLLNMLPEGPVLIALLAALGLLIGVGINYSIHQWQWFSKLPVSPWQFGYRRKHEVSAEPDSKLSPRSLLDYVPVIGWLSMRRDAAVLGKRFWLRPLLIEIGCASLVPVFYFWQTNAGLLGGAPFAPADSTTEIWFWGHLVLIVLMIIATFIDFDEKTIPDQVTIAGTVIALMLAALAPNFRLPEALGKPPGWQWTTFCSPGDIPGGNWHLTWIGLLVALLIVTVWCCALLPFLPIRGESLRETIRLRIVSVLRPRRTTECVIRKRLRGPRILTRVILVVWIAVCFLVVMVWWSRPPVANWNSLFGSIVGLGVGGGIVWAIRIVGSHAMGQEAMGFGDVTLMAMIGAFLGWQASVLTFVLAPFGGMIIASIHFIFTRRKELAFGPYLCCSALLLVICWSGLWPWARESFFWVGGRYLALIFVGALVAMSLMLGGLHLIKQAFGGIDPDES